MTAWVMAADRGSGEFLTRALSAIGTDVGFCATSGHPVDLPDTAPDLAVLDESIAHHYRHQSWVTNGSIPVVFVPGVRELAEIAQDPEFDFALVAAEMAPRSRAH